MTVRVDLINVGSHPDDRDDRGHVHAVFPARAGMNRFAEVELMMALSVPRAGGDEPRRPCGR